MSYEPTTWKSGDTVTSAKLNKIEQGIANAGGVLVCTVDESDALNHTWQEINDAGFAVLSFDEGSYSSIYVLQNIYANHDADEYGVVFSSGGETITYQATSADGYPSVQIG